MDNQDDLAGEEAGLAEGVAVHQPSDDGGQVVAVVQQLVLLMAELLVLPPCLAARVVY